MLTYEPEILIIPIVSSALSSLIHRDLCLQNDNLTCGIATAF